jgi:CIC family chloride channel protein
MMARQDALPQLALLSVLVGLVAGGIIIVFRLLVEGALTASYLGDYGESFESLEPVLRLGLCIIGGLVVGMLFSLADPASRQVGIVHVIERLAYHQGTLPLRNAALQFVGAAICMISGQSVGREGPNVHIGAASGGILGRWLRIPDNASRTLIGCGVAAAIGAGFNTPLAGVVFAMEVVLMEYTILGFTPVIIAAVSATALSRIVFGTSPAFVVPVLEWNSLGELPYVLVMGILVGCLSALFIKSTLFFSGLLSTSPYWIRTSLAGMIVGVLAMWAPQIMGVGYDTISEIMLGQMTISILAIIFLAKLLATSSAIGLGIPGGLIGPTLMLGACTGGMMGVIANQLAPEIATPGFYAMLGMGAMMGATLHAPLAALVSLLELTANHQVILPGMVAVISAVLTKRVLFKMQSVYKILMQARGLDYRNNPVAQALRRVGVASVMERNFIQHGAEISRTDAVNLLEGTPDWIMVPTIDDNATLVPASDLALHLKNSDEETINLLTFPAVRRDSSPITTLATLQEAYETMQNTGADVLHVSGEYTHGQDSIQGVITRAHVERNYQT